MGKFSSYTILYVDDEQWIMEGLVKLLELEFKVLTTPSADAALALIETQEHSIDLILLDIMMSQGRNVVDSERGRTSGLALANVLSSKEINIPIVAYTVLPDRKIHSQLRAIRNVKEVVMKADSNEYLFSVIKRILLPQQK